MEPVTAAYSDTQRMQLRALILLASEIVASYWPMRIFVHHNPLHGLEDLPFDEAVRRAHRFLGGKGYLSNARFRDYAGSGRIRSRHIDAALKPLARDKRVTIGGREVTHLDALRAHLLHGIAEPDRDTVEPLIDRRTDRAMIAALAARLGPVLHASRVADRQESEAAQAGAALVRRSTLAAWCDRVLRTQLTERINREMIKWCEAFLDEDHAAWAMPGREQSFYGAWRVLAQQEWSPCGIADSRRKIARLPPAPEDALLQHLAALGIPSQGRQEYLTLHLTALPGWAGFIKWRADQSESAWQQTFPADLVQYLAVRLWYERELVQEACREGLGIDGTVSAIAAAVSTRDDAQTPGLDQDAAMRGAAALRLLALAAPLAIDPATMIAAPPEDLKALLDWIDGFPVSEHGPVWLNAFEAGYRDQLIETLRRGRSNSEAGSDAEQPAVRPQAQAVFCIDVRSESFRRHLEAVGDFGTYGFAGFFSVFIRYRALGAHHDTDQFPVIMKAKNTVREVPRTYQGALLSRRQAGARMLDAGHSLLHDLKENVVTPYVMVESLGWFYSLPMIGKTVFTSWYRTWTAWLRRKVVPVISTAMTVDKLSREEVDEMLAAEQRSVIRRALQERFGDRDLNVSLERLEGLRRRALDEQAVPATSPEARRGYALSPEEETWFVDVLRRDYRINQGGAFARMERITQIGFTLAEQVFTVETALRVMGLTKNFARLVLCCGHGSTSDNNPFEAALDCGACGGNPGEPNARVLAAMANKAQVRDALAKAGIVIPQDTYFIAGRHDTTTDEVRLFDLEDLPHTHRNDMLRLEAALFEAGLRNNRERCARFPEMPEPLTTKRAAKEVRRRGSDWSQVRPEWGLSGNAAFIIGRRDLTRGLPLDARVFLHSYDYQGDPTGRLLEIVMTGPQVVGQWINMEHYFSTVDPEVYGSGSKIYHNVVGRFGVMSGPQSDLRTGLAAQTVMDGPRPYHEPMRLLTLIEAPTDRITQVIRRHRVLQRLYDNEWVRLAALDPDTRIFYYYVPRQGWTVMNDGGPSPHTHAS
ncbi:MAG TPA: DUF2309 domain-containing protein [Nitrospiria bacterium]|nr:DUF2309 domain-containing protein [Nitrospiria bacterium]